MATDHQISIITNSSVKPPIRPDDGLPHTLHERVSTHGYWENSENSADSDQEQSFHQPKRKVRKRKGKRERQMNNGQTN